MGKIKYTGCSIEGCNNPHIARGLCQKHYDNIRKNRNLDSLIQTPGNRKKMSNGYIMIYKKLEHVLVAEKALGKELPKKAEIHHINRIKDDKRPENLVICPNHAYHDLI